MSTTPALLTIEDYLKTTYRPDCDFVDGEIEERNVGQYDHSTLQAFMAAWFWPRRDEWQIHVVTEERVRVSRSSVRISGHLSPLARRSAGAGDRDPAAPLH